jgi:hypothetical protein
MEDQAVRLLFLFINKEVNKRKVSNWKGPNTRALLVFSLPQK